MTSDDLSNALDLRCLDLPDLASFDDDERMLARVTVGIVRNGGAMYTGRFLECVVAGLLSAKFPRLGVSPWDLMTEDGTRIEVKSGTSKFTIGPGKNVDVWVFVHKRPDEMSFTVATAGDVADIGQGSIAAGKLVRRFGEVGPAGLSDAVRAAAQASKRG